MSEERAVYRIDHQRPTPLPVTDQPRPIRSDADAVETLGDAPFIVYALMQGWKLTMSLFFKRWPYLR